MADTLAPPRLLTAEEFERICGTRRCELWRGEMTDMAPASFDHGTIGQRLSVRLGWFVEQHRLGATTLAETGFLVETDPDTVLAPDVAFIRAERMPPPGATGFSRVVPDLVAEVVSPHDRSSEVLAKAARWLDVGAEVVWVVWPERREVQVWAADGSIRVLAEADTLTCDELLPGFAASLAEVFGPRA